MRTIITLVACLLIVSISSPVTAQRRRAKPKPVVPAAPKPAPPAAVGPPLLTHAEVVQLYKQNPAPKAIEDKKNRILNTPFVDNGAWSRGSRPRSVDVPGIGPSLRAVEWNIERGIAFDDVVAALRGSETMAKRVDPAQAAPGSEDYRTVMEQADVLASADVLILNELDYGMRRSDYRFVAKELADALGMNYAYGVEFVECDPIATGTETFDEAPPEKRSELVANIQVDKSRFRGLHGSAILSRYRLDNVKIVRLPKVHDWYYGELKPTSMLEEGKRTVSEKVLLEKIGREVRRGSRFFITADIEEPRAPGGKVTIVCTHIEDKCEPKYRVDQLNLILSRIATIKNPVIFAGDMNTSTMDGTPTSVSREVKKKLGSADFWAKEGVYYATGIGLVGKLIISAGGMSRKYGDPTVRNIRIVGSNPEAKFFKTLREFAFTDGNHFDFRGDKDRAVGGKDGTLGNSNERESKGFAITFKVERTIASQGELKLDWFFVKPASLTDADDEEQPYQFAPHFARTMEKLNYSVTDRISDHNPMSVDLPFNEPSIPRKGQSE